MCSSDLDHHNSAFLAVSSWTWHGRCNNNDRLGPKPCLRHGYGLAAKGLTSYVEGGRNFRLRVHDCIFVVRAIKTSIKRRVPILGFAILNLQRQVSLWNGLGW